MKKTFFGLFLTAMLATTLTTTSFAGPNDSDWIQLFNKADTSLRTNWDVHILGSALNVDTRNTFRRVVIGSDTALEVNYDNYTNWTGNPWGHIGYKARSWNYYIVRAEHQFFGNQAAGAAAAGNTWALQNNGIMHHSQSVASMGMNQDYPISLEAQLLGPANTGADNNSTLNLCTPGTAYFATATGGSVNTAHCTSALTHNRDAALTPNWAIATVVALSDSIIRYYYRDTLVFTYYRPVQYAGNVSGNTVAIVNNTPIKGGYIVLQGESAPTRFRKVELLNLEGCMTPTDANYKAYFVKHDAAACGLPSSIRGTQNLARGIFTLSGNRIQAAGEILNVEVYDLKGKAIASLRGEGRSFMDVSNLKPGLYSLKVQTAKGSATAVYAKM